MLVVVAIIGVLASLVSSTLGRMRGSANSVKSAQNLRTLSMFVFRFAEENNNFLVSGAGTNWGENWIGMLWPYLGDKRHPHAKGHLKDTPFFAPGWDKSRFYDPNDNWKQGYALIGQPGLPEEWKLNWSIGTPGTESYTSRFNMLNITHRTRRILFIESAQWHLGDDNVSGEGTVDRERNSNSGAMAAFFDGHVEKISSVDEARRKAFNPLKNN